MLNGTIVDVSPERYDTVRLGATKALGGVGFGIIAAIPRAFAMALSIFSVFVPRVGGLAAAVPGRGMSRNGRGGPDALQVPGTPFLLEADDGTAHDCYLRGEVRGGAIRLGDRVSAYGRLDRRSGVFDVGRLVNARTGSVTRGYVDPRARWVGLRALVQLVLIVFVVLFLLSMCGFVQ